VIIHQTAEHLESTYMFITRCWPFNQDSIGTTSLIGKSVVIRNLAILMSLYQLSKIRIPEYYPQVYEQIQRSFPLIELETCAEQRFNQNQAISIASRMDGRD